MLARAALRRSSCATASRFHVGTMKHGARALPFAMRRSLRLRQRFAGIPTQSGPRRRCTRRARRASCASGLASTRVSVGSCTRRRFTTQSSLAPEIRPRHRRRSLRLPICRLKLSAAFCAMRVGRRFGTPSRREVCCDTRPRGSAVTVGAYPMTFPLSLRQCPSGPTWRSASGAIVYATDGSNYLDLTAGYGVAAVGHGHPKVVQAVCEQAARMCHAMTGIYPQETEATAYASIRNALGRAATTAVIITTSGSEAVDLGLRIALAHTGRRRLLAYQNGYHGQALGVVGITGQRALREPFEHPYGAHVHLAAYPGPSPLGVDIDDVTSELATRAYAAVVIEPVQNLAGYRPAPAEYLRALHRCCLDTDTLLIFDEVFTGFGRTAAWSVAQAIDVAPDVLCVGKAMTGGFPAGACVVDAHLARALATPAGVPLHAPTFLASPLACAAITSTIGVLSTDDLIQRAEWVGARLEQGILAMRAVADRGITIRRRGAAIAVDFSTCGLSEPANAAASLSERLLARGVIALQSGFPAGDTVSLSPSFALSDAEIDRGLTAIENACDEH